MEELLHKVMKENEKKMSKCQLQDGMHGCLQKEQTNTQIPQ